MVTLPSGLLYKEIRPGNGEFCFFSPYMSSSSSAASLHLIRRNFPFSSYIHRPQLMAKPPPLIHLVNGTYCVIFNLLRCAAIMPLK